MDPQRIGSSIRDAWDRSIVPTLERYIRIPNQSPLFDPEWKAHGYMNQAVTLARDWVGAQQISGLSSTVYEMDGRTPLLSSSKWREILPQTVLMYGHLDKQPAMIGWEEGLGPWEPVLRDGRLYGRGGADDGYAVFSAVTRHQGAARRRHPTLTHRRHHRMLRGERLHGPPRLHRPAGSQDRHARPGHLSRQRLRQTTNSSG